MPLSRTEKIQSPSFAVALMCTRGRRSGWRYFSALLIRFCKSCRSGVSAGKNPRQRVARDNSVGFANGASRDSASARSRTALQSVQTGSRSVTSLTCQ